MAIGRTVFAQLMDFVPDRTFRRIVARHKGNHRSHNFSCWDQFLAMAFAQLTYRDGLRDIHACLSSLGPSLYHSGMRSDAPKSTLADANEHRPWEIYRDLAMALIARARVLYHNEQLIEQLDAAVYALDATTIKLCLALFPWAKAQNHLTTSAGVKLHTLLDVQRHIPVFARVSVANLYEVHILDELLFEPGAFYVFDRAYTDFRRLKHIDASGAYFVIRAKQGLRFSRLVSHPVDKERGVLVDQTIRLVIARSLEGYPDQLRRIKFFDTASARRFIYLTNNFLLDPSVIAELYRSRWQIELFFKWIKQHLRIKAFYGTSPNAVQTQIWIALAVFVLVAIVKKELNIDKPLYTILQILSVTLFQYGSIYQVLTATQPQILGPEDPNQLNLFTF